MNLCPECREGKHRNCTTWTLDGDDNMVDCECPQHVTDEQCAIALQAMQEALQRAVPALQAMRAGILALGEVGHV